MALHRCLRNHDNSLRHSYPERFLKEGDLVPLVVWLKYFVEYAQDDQARHENEELEKEIAEDREYTRVVIKSMEAMSGLRDEVQAGFEEAKILLK